MAEPELSTHFGWESGLIPRDLAHCLIRQTGSDSDPEGSISPTPTPTSLLIHKLTDPIAAIKMKN